jgi:hypothetical protein
MMTVEDGWDPTRNISVEFGYEHVLVKFDNVCLMQA